MEVSRASQFLDPSSAMATLTKQKLESIKLAREQAAAVHEMCRRAKSEVPPYEFEELIGKGAYGRVYKGRQLPSRDLVAIKVMDIDTLDYKMHRDMKDESIKDFIHEIKAMNQAKEAGARNINMLIEAISIHSQLWVVCEYCPGGSVKTLASTSLYLVEMRATGDKLEEKYIIPIARELASGLRAIHDAGIIHRDVKAGNILIHEEGRLQICDFGVAGILQSKVDKRSTWIGTPHWMPPEMFSTRGGEAHQYGSELDVWAYGCTLYEFATGNPPNAGLRERMQIGRALGRNTPKLEGDQYSQELKNLVAFSLNSDPLTRPTMATILEHPYIAGSETEYPTKSLSELVRNYYQWSQRGGQRMSLFHPGGAAAAEFPDNPQFEEDWNFSTTDGFERRYSVLDLDQLSASLAELAGNEPSFPQNPEPSMDDMTITEMTPIEKANFDERVKRGAAAMEGLFDEHKPTYKYETKSDFVPIEEKEAPSDLPLRTTTDRSSVTSTFIDINLGSFDSAHYAAGTASQFQLADADTIRANRSSLRSGRNSDGEQSRNRYSDVESETDTFQPNAPRPPTMDWKFPTMIVPEDNEPETLPAPVADTEPFISPAEEKRATRDWKFPVMTDTANEEMPILEKDNLYTYDETPAHTIRPAQVQTHQSRSSHQSQQSTLDLSLGHVNNNLSVDGLDVAAISRPSTATSTISDYDPFRFDRSPDNSQRTHHRMASKAPSLFSISSLDEGPGPDHEDDIIVEEDGPGPDHEDIPELTPNATAGTSMTAQMELSQQRQRAASSSSRDLSRPTSQTLQFPEVQFPSAESMMEGASDDVITAELDRLIDDFMQACYSTINVVENME
ncbi:serine/threonin protein kinase, putative [Talaromyces marneffei ATCC 18224]|uniref:non-specific serine/threonine protein kinase n=1 Tax=Talaromyces marneffei (strain ATCC 18224 / CBS 334.59 / QM 7333) TaxID=441960 RepID=B6Q746_TALMQ|nr:serine/threonin protein kinase, putative [Talaromyces marneffei ATCC 18224]